MRIMKKSSKAYKTIGEVAEILELDSVGSKKNTHTIRYWGSEFKQIKPIIINKRRYYDDKNIDILRKIKFLLKDKGMTISGAKKQLNEDFFEIDANENKTTFLSLIIFSSLVLGFLPIRFFLKRT